MQILSVNNLFRFIMVCSNRTEERLLSYVSSGNLMSKSDLTVGHGGLCKFKGKLTVDDTINSLHSA